MPSTVHIDSHREWGGGQQQSLALALALAERGRPTFFIAQSGSDLAARLASTDLRWEAMSLRGVGGLAAVPRLARRFRQLRPDIIHCHDSAAQVPAGLAARRAASVPTIVTRRTTLPLSRGPLRRSLDQRICARVICVSEAVRQQCLEVHMPAERLVVIPDFVDCAHFDPAAAAADDAGPPTVGIVGRLSQEKGHAVLLAAMRRVADSISDIRLLISGEGPEGERLRRQAGELGISDRVEFLGFVPDVRAVLAAADVFAMPSVSEGLGVAALEAMAMRRPVVASDAGGLPESVVHGMTGLIVPAGDADSLAQALTELLRDPARAREMGEAGRARVLAHYDRARVVDRILDLYREVLSGG